METKVILSEKYTLQLRDYVKGLGLAVASAVVSALYDVLTSTSGSIEDIDWKVVLRIALTAGLLYIGKNWLVEPAKVITTTTNNADAVQASKDIKKVV